MLCIHLVEMEEVIAVVNKEVWHRGRGMVSHLEWVVFHLLWSGFSVHELGQFNWNCISGFCSSQTFIELALPGMHSGSSCYPLVSVVSFIQKPCSIYLSLCLGCSLFVFQVAYFSFAWINSLTSLSFKSTAEGVWYFWQRSLGSVSSLPFGIPFTQNPLGSNNLQRGRVRSSIVRLKSPGSKLASTCTLFKALRASACFISVTLDALLACARARYSLLVLASVRKLYTMPTLSIFCAHITRACERARMRNARILAFLFAQIFVWCVLFMQPWYVIDLYVSFTLYWRLQCVYIVNTVLCEELLNTENLCRIACGTAILYKDHFLWSLTSF